MKILGREEAAEHYRKKFSYIFVDEYQDSNLVQEKILNLIKRENNLFLVGDVKQSIYRFRLADPSLFIAKYKEYQKSNSLHQRIDLNKNFRSRKEIIAGVNFIFKGIMSEEFGEINYDEDSYLYHSIRDEEMENPEIELSLIEKNYAGQVDEELAELEDAEVEAAVVASKIKNLLQIEIYDRKLKQKRKVQYKDIVVLLRSPQNWAESFTKVFAARGIPVYADVNTGYFQTLEITVFLNLLKIIDNRRQDIPLLSVLFSPIFNFTIKDLITIRLNCQKGSYFEAVQEYLKNGAEPELKNKIILFLEKLEIWRTKAEQLSLEDFIWEILLESKFYYYVGTLPNGKERQANLRLLLERAAAFQKTSLKGLFNFLKFVEELDTADNDLSTAKTLSENDNVVRIMSIHKSKGLEFPLVILAGAGKNFNLKDSREGIVFHKELGFGPKYIDCDLRISTDTLARLAIKNKVKLKSLAEEMRVLYVACTRPQDKLIIVGSVRDLESKVKKWANPSSPYTLTKGENYLDWICPLLMRHQDGKILRDMAGFGPGMEEMDIEEDDSKWHLEIIDRSQISLTDDRKTAEKEKNVKKNRLQLSGGKVFFEEQFKNCVSKLSPQDRDMVKKSLDWKYPFEAASQVPAKLSVSEIKKLELLQTFPSAGVPLAVLKRPRFLQVGKKLTSAERGTVVHFVLGHLDLKKVNSSGEIKAQIAEMVAKGQLSPEEAEVVDEEKIKSFFQSGLGQRIITAEKVYREVPFNLLKKAGELIPGLEECQESLLLQGVIDIFFVEGDELVLVDYKTDRIFGENMEKVKKEIIERYGVQLALYAEALEKIRGQRVKESYLYFLNGNMEQNENIIRLN